MARTLLAVVAHPHCVPIPGLGVVCGVTSILSQGIGDVLLQSLTAWLAAGATWLLEQVGAVLTATTAPAIGAVWFHRNFAAMVTVAAPVALVALLMVAIDAVAHGDPRRMVRAVVVQLPLAVLGSTLAISLTQLSLGATDALCRSFATSAGVSTTAAIEAVASRFGGLGAIVTGGLPGCIAALAAVLAIVASLALWFELALRGAAIDVAVLFFPLVLAAQVHPALTRWGRRLAEVLGGLIASKFVVVAVLCLATSALGASRSSASALLSGVLLLLLAAFSPYAIFRIIPLAEGVVVAGLEGHRQRGAAALQRSALLGTRAAMAVSGAGGVPGIEALAAAGPTPLPTAEDAGLSVVSLEVATGTPAPPRPPHAARHTPERHRFDQDHLGPVLRFIEGSDAP